MIDVHDATCSYGQRHSCTPKLLPDIFCAFYHVAPEHVYSPSPFSLGDSSRGPGSTFGAPKAERLKPSRLPKPPGPAVEQRVPKQ